MARLISNPCVRRWIVGVSGLVVFIFAIGVFGGFEARGLASIAERRAGQDIVLQRITIRIDRVTHSAGYGMPNLKVHATITNTTRESLMVTNQLLYVRLPDRSVVPKVGSGEHIFIRDDLTGARLDPGIPAAASITIRTGIPDQRPSDVVVGVTDERLRPATEVAAERWVVGDLVARVPAPVTESTP